MACVVLLEIQLKEECVDQLKSAWKEMFPDTRTFDGCIDIYATQDLDNPTTVYAVEQWESRQHHEKYLAWRTERGDLDAFGAMIAGEPRILYSEPFDA